MVGVEGGAVEGAVVEGGGREGRGGEGMEGGRRAWEVQAMGGGRRRKWKWSGEVIGTLISR